MATGKETHCITNDSKHSCLKQQQPLNMSGEPGFGLTQWFSVEILDETMVKLESPASGKHNKELETHS